MFVKVYFHHLWVSNVFWQNPILISIGSGLLARVIGILGRLDWRKMLFISDWFGGFEYVFMFTPIWGIFV